MNNRDKSIIYFILGLYTLMIKLALQSLNNRLTDHPLYFLAHLPVV